MVLHPDGHSVVERINAWAAELDRVSGEYADAVRQAAKDRIAYEREYARAIVTTQGKTVAERESAALLKVEQDSLKTKRMTSEAEVEALKALMRNAEAQIDAARSNNAAVNASLRESGPR